MSNEEREPLLSDEAFWSIADNVMELRAFADIVRDFYEAKITSGELRVVKEVENSAGDFSYFKCSGCAYGHDFEVGASDFTFCPGCGAKIVP